MLMLTISSHITSQSNRLFFSAAPLGEQQEARGLGRHLGAGAAGGQGDEGHPGDNHDGDDDHGDHGDHGDDYGDNGQGDAGHTGKGPPDDHPDDYHDHSGKYEGHSSEECYVTVLPNNCTICTTLALVSCLVKDLREIHVKSNSHFFPCKYQAQTHFTCQVSPFCYKSTTYQTRRKFNPYFVTCHKHAICHVKSRTY